MVRAGKGGGDRSGRQDARGADARGSPRSSRLAGRAAASSIDGGTEPPPGLLGIGIPSFLAGLACWPPATAGV